MKAPTEIEILAFAEEQWGKRCLRQLGLKLCAEAGEMADEILKVEEGRSDDLKVVDEAADVVFVLAQVAAYFNLTLVQLVQLAWDKCQARAEQAKIDNLNKRRLIRKVTPNLPPLPPPPAPAPPPPGRDEILRQRRDRRKANKAAQINFEI